MNFSSLFRFAGTQLCLGLAAHFHSSAAPGDQVSFLIPSYYNWTDQLLLAGDQFYKGERSSAASYYDRSNYLIRLNADGSRDPDFNVAPLLGKAPFNPGYHGFGWSGATTNDLFHYALRESGHLLVTGHFGNGNDGETYRGSGAYGFSIDPAGIGKPDFKTPASLTLSPVASGTVLQSDGKILVNIDYLKEGPRLIRLNSDLTQDTSFSAPKLTTEAQLNFSAVALQADGKILITGKFTPAGGSTLTNFVRRLHPDGSADPGFEKYFDILPVSILPLSSGGILIGGAFTQMDGKPYSNLVLLRNDGTVDEAFNPRVNGRVNSLTQQTDGKILIGGSFTSVAGIPHNLLARLNADGTPDSSFTAALSATWKYTSSSAPNPGDIKQVSVLGNGEILVAGSFATKDGVTRAYAKFANTPANSVLERVSASTARWLPGGTAPVVHKVIFDHQPPGSSTWTPIGNGSPATGGWELTDVTMPAQGQLRARGILPGSGGWIEDAAVIGAGISLPEWRTHHFGSPENAGPGAGLADPDGDGYPNLVEYLAGSDPKTPTASPLPPWTVSGDALNCRIPVLEGLTPLSVKAEWTSDLTSPWQPVSDAGGPSEHVFTIPRNGYSSLFARLKVSSD